MKTIATFLIIVGAFAFVEIANAQQVIFLVRHAEDQRSEKDRPHLTRGKGVSLLASALKVPAFDDLYQQPSAHNRHCALAKALQIEPVSVTTDHEV